MASLHTPPIENVQTLLSEEVLYTVQSYFEIKVVHEEGGTLFFFLDKRLHELFHYFVKQTPCCDNTTSCLGVKIKGNLTKDQFFLLYEKDPLIHSTHEKKDNGRTTKHCICPLSPNTATDVTDLDFTIINCLMKTCLKTPAGHPQWLKDIIDVRNELSHLGDTSCISDQQIKDWWVKLENAAVNIAGTIGVVHQKGVQRRIAKIKTNQSKLEDEIKKLQTGFDELPQKIFNYLENMGVNNDGVRIRISSAALQQNEPLSSSDSATPTSSKDSKICTVVWKFSSPGDWNVNEMQKKLDCISIIGDFNVEFVYEGSLIVHTTTDRKIVSDVEVFKEATEEFLLLFTKRLRVPVTVGVYPVNVALLIWNHKMSKESVNITYSQVTTLKLQLPIQSTLIKQIDISGGWFSYCTCLDKTYVICDRDDKKLIICGGNSDNIHLSETPWWVTAIDHTKVAVGMLPGVIQIIDVIKRKTIRTIKVKSYIGGLSYHENHLYFGTLLSVIKVINLRGKIRRCIKTQTKPNYVTLDNDYIFYTDGSNKLFCSSLTGEVIWMCDISMVRTICGFSLDDDGYIYVSGNDSNNVVVISPDGKQFRQLLSVSDGLKKPRGICYNSKLKRLMVCNERGPALLYKIEK